MLSKRDRLGINDELLNYETLKTLGFNKYITHVNPVYVPSLWKKEIGKGPDLILQIGDFTHICEEKFCSYDYPYRKSWFMKTVVPRFDKYPRDYFHRRIVLTNRPNNFNSVKDLAKKFGIKIMGFEELVTYLDNIILLTKSLSFTNPSIDNILNTLSNSKLCVTYIQKSKDENREFININELEKDRQSKKLEKLKKLKRTYPYLLRIPESWLV